MTRKQGQARARRVNRRRSPGDPLDSMPARLRYPRCDDRTDAGRWASDEELAASDDDPNQAIGSLWSEICRRHMTEVRRWLAARGLPVQWYQARLWRGDCYVPMFGDPPESIRNYQPRKDD